MINNTFKLTNDNRKQKSKTEKQFAIAAEHKHYNNRIYDENFLE